MTLSQLQAEVLLIHLGLCQTISEGRASSTEFEVLVEELKQKIYMTMASCGLKAC